MSKIIWSRIDLNLKNLAEKVAKTKGITFSEYVRSLIIEDLDKHLFFTKSSKNESGTQPPEIIGGSVP